MVSQSNNSFTSASPARLYWCINNATLPFGGASGYGTATGQSLNQHRGWEQMELLYKRCEVIAVRLKLEAMVTDTATEAMQLGMVVSAGLQVPDTHCRRLKELPHSRVLLLSSFQAAPAFTTMQFNVQDIYASGRGLYIKDDFAKQCSSAANPSRTIYITVIGNVYDLSGTNAIRYELTVEQIIEFYEPIALAAQTEPVPPPP